LSRDPQVAIGLLEGLDDHEAAAALAASFGDSWDAPPGELETISTLYLIERGVVEIILPIGQGIRNVPVLISLGPGNFFGETRLLFPEPLARARVVSENGAAGRLLRRPTCEDQTEPLEQLFVAHPRVALNLVAEISRRLLAASRFVPSHAAPLRLGYFLLGLSAREHAITVSGTAALSAQLGLSAPAVTHALATLEGARLVTVQRSDTMRIDVPDRATLADYLGLGSQPES
jgi:CRP-like cAMP-binding protein